MIHRLLLLAALLCTGACAASRSIPPPDPAPAPDPMLERTGQGPREGALATRGLTGMNKPNGLEYRYRRGVPAETPEAIPRTLDGLPLVLADATPDGWLALYEQSAGLGPNPTYRAALFGPQDAQRWRLDLNPFFSRPTQLEVQDLRYRDGKLYFNEGCQTYAREADGQCSALVRVDVATRTVDWRTPPLTSNDIFILYGPYVIAGYGFTAEPDYLYLIDAATGEVLDDAFLESAHDYLEVKDGALHVLTQDHAYTYTLPALR